MSKLRAVFKQERKMLVGSFLSISFTSDSLLNPFSIFGKSSFCLPLVYLFMVYIFIFRIMSTLLVVLYRKICYFVLFIHFLHSRVTLPPSLAFLWTLSSCLPSCLFSCIFLRIIIKLQTVLKKEKMLLCFFLYISFTSALLFFSIF